jgi:hypothetical protein
LTRKVTIKENRISHAGPVFCLVLNQVEIMLYVNNPEKCAKFWSEQVGFIVKEEGEGPPKVAGQGRHCW